MTFIFFSMISSAPIDLKNYKLHIFTSTFKDKVEKNKLIRHSQLIN
jgi:hypothetical protein